MAAAATPVRTIARILTKEGIPSPYGRTSWTDSGVRVILGNSYYWGKPKVMRYRVIRGTVIDRRTGAQKIGKKITRSDEPVAVPLTVAPALISEDLAHLAEKNRRRMPGDPYKKHPISLLHGRIICGECGKRCIEQPSFSGFHYYRCASHNHNLAKVSCHVHIPTKLLDEQVWYALTRKLSDEPALVEDFVISALGEAPSPQYLKEQLESLEQQQADLVDGVAMVGGKAGNYPLAWYTRHTAAKSRAWSTVGRSIYFVYATIKRSRYRRL